MRNGRYITDESGNPVECDDLLRWGAWFETQENRRVALDDLGEARVSTVFLGLDHSFVDRGPPVLWETMVFGGPLDGEMERYSSRESAVDGHAIMVARVKAYQ